MSRKRDGTPARALWRLELERVARCALLGHTEAAWVRRVTSSGSIQCCFWCPTCRRPVTADRYHTRGPFVGPGWLHATLGLDAAEIPVIRHEVAYHLCARCGRTTPCELHHVAWQAAFPDADDWPKIPLFPSCHQAFTRGVEAYVQRRIQAAMARASRQTA